MNRNLLLFLQLLASVFLLINLVGIDKKPESIFKPVSEKMDEQGIARMKIKDEFEGGENLKALYLRIGGIEYLQDGNWKAAPDFKGPMTINLLDYEAQNQVFLGNLRLPVGKYTEIRLKLESADNPDHAATASYAILKDGSVRPLQLESVSGDNLFHAKGNFVVPENGVVDLTVNIDLKYSGKSSTGGSFHLKPVIRLISSSRNTIMV